LPLVKPSPAHLTIGSVLGCWWVCTSHILPTPAKLLYFV